MEEYEYPKNTYDLVITNLVLHYVADLDSIFAKVYQTLKTDGIFLFNIEHPVFTAGINEDWLYAEDGTPQHGRLITIFTPVNGKPFFRGSMSPCNTTH